MKKLIILATLLLVFILLLWTGFQKVVENQVGFYYIDAKFAMIDKALFLYENEYNHKKRLHRTVQLCRENAIREVYIEITSDTKFKNIKNIIKTFDMYGIKVGYWYNLQRIGMPTSLEITDEIILRHKEYDLYDANIYFVLQPVAEDYVKYKESYLDIIIDVTKRMIEVRDMKDDYFPININWVLPSIVDEEINAIYNGYSKRLNFHALDVADSIALIPNVESSYKQQVLNEIIYAKRLRKQVDVAINRDRDINMFETYEYIHKKLHAEYQEILHISPTIKILFLDQNTLFDTIRCRYDLNRDGKIDLKDFLTLLEVYITGNATGEHDFNHNGVVDAYDILSMFMNLKGRF